VWDKVSDYPSLPCGDFSVLFGQQLIEPKRKSIVKLVEYVKRERRWRPTSTLPKPAGVKKNRLANSASPVRMKRREMEKRTLFRLTYPNA
jgi:hypothetical protein